MMSDMGVDVDGHDSLRSYIKDKLHDSILTAKSKVTIDDFRSLCSMFFKVNLTPSQIQRMGFACRALEMDANQK